MKPINSAAIITLLATALLLPVTADAKRPSKNTVLYLRANADELVNTEVTVDVSWMQEFTGPLAPKVAGYTAIRLHTWDENQNIIGGAIGLLVPKAEAQALLKKYPTVPDVNAVYPRSPETRSLKATLRKGRTGNLYLDLDGTAEAVVNATGASITSDTDAQTQALSARQKKIREAVTNRRQP